MLTIKLEPSNDEKLTFRKVKNLGDLGAYIGGIFTVIFAVVSFISNGITKFYSNSSIINNLYKIKVQKEDGTFEENFKISEL